MATAAGSNIDLAFIPTPEPPTVTVRRLGAGMVGIARVRCETDGLGPLDAPVIEDAVLVSHHLSNFRSDVWVDGKPVEKPSRIAGLTTIHDFRRAIACRMHSAFDTVTFHLSRTTLEAVFPDAADGRFDDLAITPSHPVEDSTIAALANAALAVLDDRARVSPLLLDHIGCALAIHLVTAYGRCSAGRGLGTLAPWQERRAKEMIDARLDGELRLADLAAECRLSVGHFTRAFRLTTGTTPHQWLLTRRVERAKALMRDGDRSLADIALDCGFADQSHFTRTFTRIAGLSPSAWRRRHAVAGFVVERAMTSLESAVA